MSQRRHGAVVGLLLLAIHLVTLVLVVAALTVRWVWTVVAAEVRRARAS